MDQAQQARRPVAQLGARAVGLPRRDAARLGGIGRDPDRAGDRGGCSRAARALKGYGLLPDAGREHACRRPRAAGGERQRRRDPTSAPATPGATSSARAAWSSRCSRSPGPGEAHRRADALVPRWPRRTIRIRSSPARAGCFWPLAIVLALALSWAGPVAARRPRLARGGLHRRSFSAIRRASCPARPTCGAVAGRWQGGAGRAQARDPYLDRDALKISVFMNVFNVHSNRSPVDGEVREQVVSRRQLLQRRARQGFAGERALRAAHRHGRPAATSPACRSRASSRGASSATSVRATDWRADSATASSASARASTSICLPTRHPVSRSATR